VERDVLTRLRRLLDDPEPGRRAVLATLFEREAAMRAAVVVAALGVADLDRLIDLGLVRPFDGGYAPLARFDRAATLVVASDLRRRRRQRDFVVQPGPASFLLGRFIRPVRGGRALDLGCGSGIQALRLALAGASVLALDVNSRALGFSRFNAALNGFRTIMPVLGDFLGAEPDRALDGRFDVVVANPPFVLAPSHELLYRDRPLPGDEVTRRTIERVARALAPEGRGYVLGNWIDPVRGWTADAGVSGAVVHVASHNPATYAATWTKDLPPPDREAANQAWAGALAAEGVSGIHIGVLALRRSSRTAAVARFTSIEPGDAPLGWQPLERGLVG
jgi:SAM-dependent methyltransferase